MVYVMLLVSVKSITVFQTDTLYSCLLSLVSLSLWSLSLWSPSHTPIVVYIYICFIATENSSVFNLCCTELVQHNHIHSIHWPFTHPFTCNTFTFNWPFVHTTGTCTTYIYIIKGTLVTVWMDCDFWRTYWIFVLMSVLTDYFLSADLYWRMVGVFCTDVFFYFLQLVDCLHRCIFPQLYAKLCNIISVNQSNGIWQIHVVYSKSKCLT